MQSNGQQKLPCAKSWDHYLSQESRSRKLSTLKRTGEMVSVDSIALGTARPYFEFYPWEFASFGPVETSSSNGTGTNPETKETYVDNTGPNSDLTIALNYGESRGLPKLVEFLTEHIQFVHNPIYQNWEVCMTSGTTSGLEVVYRMLCERDHYVLMEEYTYTGAIETVKPLGLRIKGVKMDKDGLLPDDLDNILTNWDPSQGQKPFVLYTIPTGHNPTGITQSVSRRKAIYEVAEKHDLIIVEDDPYYFIQMNLQVGARYSQRTAYLDQLLPSYLSLDTSGRVLRLDTASKILAPGLRCGWITGCKQLIQQFIKHTELSTKSPCGVAQLMMYKLVAETWGQDGFIDWFLHLSKQYQSRRDILLTACQQYLPKDMFRWDIPSSGMFAWLSCSVQSKVDDKSSLEDHIFEEGAQKGVMVSKGSWFYVGNDVIVRNVCFRLTFASCGRQFLEEAVIRFARAVMKYNSRNNSERV